jgi:hypothetical protein
MKKGLPTLHAAGRVGSWFVDIKETAEQLPRSIRIYCTAWNYLDPNVINDDEFAEALRKGRAVLAKSRTDPETGPVTLDDSESQPYIGLFSVTSVNVTRPSKSIPRREKSNYSPLCGGVTRV